MDCILIVDDSAEALEMHKQYLGQRYRIICCRNGAAALELLEKELPQLILLDIEMPGMNGYTVLEKI